MTDISSDSIQKEEPLTNFEEDVNPVDYSQEKEPDSVEEEGDLAHSLKAILSAENYRVYLITAWIYGSVAYLQSYFNLYLRALGWDLIVMGAVLSVLAVFASIMRLLGGYVGDVANRKNLSVAAVLFISVFYLIVGLFVDPVMIIVALLAYQSHELMRSGSSAYILENTPKKHSGLAMSLFTAGKGLGIVTLVVFGSMIPIFGFTAAYRTLFLISGIILFFSALGRAKYLSYEKPPGKKSDKKWELKNFLFENRRAAELLVLSVPGLLSIVIIDGISDSFFGFAALIYANEVLAIDISGINIILLTYTIISVPVVLKIGRISDRKGTRRAALIVYSFMPVSASLLMIAPFLAYWAPGSWIFAADSVYSGLGVIFSTAFVAILLKYLNDVLWSIVLLTLIQKSLPKKDTAKILSIFWFTVYICSSIAPLIAGAIFKYLSPTFLFGLMLILNLIILVSIKTGPFAKNNSSADGNQKDVVE